MNSFSNMKVNFCSQEPSWLFGRVMNKYWIISLIGVVTIFPGKTKAADLFRPADLSALYSSSVNIAKHMADLAENHDTLKSKGFLHYYFTFATISEPFMASPIGSHGAVISG